MEKSPESGTSAEDNEENDEFLCAIAAESINDAIVLLRELNSGPSIAMPHLENALTLLATDGHSVADCAESTGAPGIKSAVPGAGLSPMAIDLIVERRLRELDADMKQFAQKKQILQPHMQSEVVTQTRQQAIALMIEALSLLDSVRDDEATGHLQLALDRAIGQQPDILTRRRRQQKPH
ncbi:MULTISPECIES: hypothetical protein [Sphingomonadales]|jgi:hypothetical protein|uniref:Uncharacterized protein n=2 Tax=Sphingomonadaceae TaxID=41297 RepID=A0A397PC25_9SPHN|nr:MULTISPECIES: hypothetical protein [Sphingomonadaceae]EKU73407.1 hypothetical protein HMPREF9718_03876 [Sphingobium yanoikuyae ATCC 51230]RIA45963.1 hypothetical protein DFR49_0492 [Hephaestia caeni]WQE08192.1 hypothetical protein U0025_04695 [Sphingobium yanoikuyae]